MKSLRLDLKQLIVCVAIFAAGVFASAQEAKQGPASVPAAGSAPAAAPMKSETTLKATTRMVTVEVVARDGRGHPVTGLTAKDFQVFEQVPPDREQLPETIAAFLPVGLAEISAASKGRQKMPPGIYTNAVAMQPKVPVPPTILLVDGLNTDFQFQLQVHKKMVKLLGSMPDQVPVAVFLLGRRLHLLQGLTTDPKLLREAAEKALSMDALSVDLQDPRDDPGSLSAAVEEPALEQDAMAIQAAAAHGGTVTTVLPGTAMLNAIRQFEWDSYALQVDIRKQLTVDAMRAIARYVAGYPGRKNLLWISSSFPLKLLPDLSGHMIDTSSDVVRVARALADAKVAVYPMDPAGLTTQRVFDVSGPMSAGRDVRTPITDPNSIRDPNRRTNITPGALMREAVYRNSGFSTMDELSDETGGRICINNNDLADCVKKAVDDGSSYYELAYYPDSSNWHGEFHRVVVKATASGVHLSYRKGYYARLEESRHGAGNGGSPQPKQELQQAACQDLLPSTAVLLATEAIPAGQPGQAKYFLAIDTGTLSFVPVGGGGQDLHLEVALCTFDKHGQPLQYQEQDSDQKLTDKEYGLVMGQHAMPQTVSLVPKPDTARIRLLVRDAASGLMGSVDVPYSETASTPPPAPAPAGTAGPAPGSPQP